MAKISSWNQNTPARLVLLTDHCKVPFCLDGKTEDYNDDKNDQDDEGADEGGEDDISVASTVTTMSTGSVGSNTPSLGKLTFINPIHPQGLNSSTELNQYMTLF